jgi:hypothetical protein
LIVKDASGNSRKAKISKMFTFEGISRKEVDVLNTGDIAIIAFNNATEEKTISIDLSQFTDIKEFKAASMLTFVTLAAFNRELKINQLRSWTDGLEKGSESLNSFKTAVGLVTVDLGANYADVVKRAGEIQKDLNLSFSSKVFKDYLMTQNKIIAATNMEGDVLNKLFLTVSSIRIRESLFLKFIFTLSYPYL